MIDNDRPTAVPVTIEVNGRRRTTLVEPRHTLGDVLREQLGLTGTHLGCEHGVCGACTVLLDGEPVRSCLVFAMQLDGAAITTIEGLADSDGTLHPVQEAFTACHGLQCGFCTPGFVLTAVHLLQQRPNPDRATIRHELSGNLCRCTGYIGIVDAVELAAKHLAGGSPPAGTAQ
ncbi:MAG: (2Fe-2S)-binding protein [Acidimicrobiales bacterium]